VPTASAAVGAMQLGHGLSLHAISPDGFCNPRIGLAVWGIVEFAGWSTGLRRSNSGMHIAHCSATELRRQASVVGQASRILLISVDGFCRLCPVLKKDSPQSLLSPPAGLPPAVPQGSGGPYIMNTARNCLERVRFQPHLGLFSEEIALCRHS
jgi:hypothetical protein